MTGVGDGVGEGVGEGVGPSREDWYSSAGPVEVFGVGDGVGEGVGVGDGVGDGVADTVGMGVAVSPKRRVVPMRSVG